MSTPFDLKRTSQTARERIFAKLNAAQRAPMPEPDTAAYYAQATPKWSNEIERLKHWARTMRRFNTQIHWVNADNWTEALCAVVRDKQIGNILLPMNTAHGQAAHQALAQHAPKIQSCGFERPIEDWKDELFDRVDAGFTNICAGIAQTGTLLLWPDAQQPRSMSLVPPIHIALFDTTTLHDDFFSAMQSLGLAHNTPSNLVLISSPSKTSDIQLTLAFGAHGPRDLVVLAQLPAHIALADVEEAA